MSKAASKSDCHERSLGFMSWQHVTESYNAVQVTDTTTFTDDRRREELDAWLYETCTQCLQHMVDIVVQFYDALQPLLSRIFDLLANFIRSAWALTHALSAWIAKRDIGTLPAEQLVSISRESAFNFLKSPGVTKK